MTGPPGEAAAREVVGTAVMANEGATPPCARDPMLALSNMPVRFIVVADPRVIGEGGR